MAKDADPPPRPGPKPYVPDHGYRSGWLGQEWEAQTAKLREWEAEDRAYQAWLSKQPRSSEAKVLGDPSPTTGEDMLVPCAETPQLCGAYLGDNDGTCPQLTCIRDKGHDGDHDNVHGDHEPVPSVYDVDVPPGQWAVVVRGGTDGADWRCVFVSGVQGFTICERPFYEPEARETCEWYAKQFRTAMAALGAPPEMTPRRPTATVSAETRRLAGEEFCARAAEAARKIEIPSEPLDGPEVSGGDPSGVEAVLEALYEQAEAAVDAAFYAGLNHAESEQRKAVVRGAEEMQRRESARNPRCYHPTSALGCTICHDEWKARERAPADVPHDMSRAMTVGELRRKLDGYGNGTLVMIQGPDDTTWPMAAWVGTDEDEEHVFLPARRAADCASPGSGAETREERCNARPDAPTVGGSPGVVDTAQPGAGQEPGATHSSGPGLDDVFRVLNEMHGEPNWTSDAKFVIGCCIDRLRSRLRTAKARGT